jgi:chromatin assembly factor 1 subunit A
VQFAIQYSLGNSPHCFHILSDKTLSALVKHVHRELLPTQEDGEDGDASSSSASSALSLNVVEAAIKAIVARHNYGLDGIPGGGKPPAAVCVWRWEVKEQHRDWLPKIARAKAEIRLAERAQVSSVIHPIVHQGIEIA